MDSTLNALEDAGDAANPEEVAALLSALADPTRLRILALLRTGDHCVCEVHQSLGLAAPTASHHLALLRRAGLVGRRRDRFWVHYQLTSRHPDAFRSLVEAVEARVAASPQGRDDRLKLETLPACCAHPRGTTTVEARRASPCGRSRVARSAGDRRRA